MVDYITELFYDGVWNNITPDVRDSDAIVMERGRRDWATVSDPSTCSLKLNNGVSKVAFGVSGRYSSDNPRSDLYQKIGLNTPIRVREDTTRTSFAVLPASGESYLSTPDVAALDIVGDIDIRVDIQPTTWRPEGGMGLARKYVTTSDERSWALWLNEAGTLSFRWSPDGTFASAITVVSDAIPEASTRLSVRITLDVDNGAAGNDVIFYTAPSIDETYTQLGATDTGAGVTSIHSGTADVEVGRTNDPDGLGVATENFQGNLYAVSIRSVIAGTEVANPNLNGQEPETRTFTDDAGRVWTLHDSVVITDPTIRFTGEAKSWPAEWDLSGADRWVKLTAAGLTRRLEQGEKPLKSSLFRDLSIKDDIVAYWPLEELKGATQFTAGRIDDASVLLPLSPTQIKIAGDNETFFASAALPTVRSGAIAGNVPNYSGANDQRFVALVSIPPDVTWATEKGLFRLYTTGTIKRWELTKSSADNLRVRAFDADGVAVEDTPYALNMFGVPCAFSLWLKQDGADIDYQIAMFPLDGSTALAGGATIAGETFGRFSRVALGVFDDIEDTTFGHAFILNDDVQSIWDTITNSMVGWTGETGLDRLVRLTSDDGLPPVRSIGANDSEVMGPQLIKTQMELFREVPTTDLGILGDRPDAIGLQYRSRIDLYSQEPKVVLDYASGLIDRFRPVRDDKDIRNEITVQRVRGSSLTVADTTGPLSSLDFPNGVGRYDIKQEINIEEDDRLDDQAYWRLHLGTINESRFPDLVLNMRNPRIEALVDSILSITEGDLIRITNPPEWLPGGPYDLMVEGIKEEKTSVTHKITFNCSPGSAWNAFVLDDAEFGRLDAENSTLTNAVTATETSFSVTTAAGSQPWLRQNIGLVLPNTVDSYASTPDVAALDIVGDIEIRATVRRDSWSEIAAGGETIVSKYRFVNGQRSYWLTLTTDGLLHFRWSANGTANLEEFSSVPVPLQPGGRISLRVTRSAATGDVTFYYSDAIDGTYTQLGSVQTSAASAIFASPTALLVGQSTTGAATNWNGDIYSVRVYDGIGGTVVANPSFASQAIGTISFTDSAGRVWTVVGDAAIKPADSYQIAVGGEVMQIHSITSATSPQTFTVQRAVNGVVKAHTSGTEVVLAKPFRLSL